MRENNEITKKRVNDKVFNENFKMKERDRKRRQRALKKTLKTGSSSVSSSDPETTDSFGDSILPLDIDVSDNPSTNMSSGPMFSSTPISANNNFKIRIPFKDKSNHSRQSK